MLEGFSLGNYLLLFDYTGRLFRECKAAISREVAAILELQRTRIATVTVSLRSNPTQIPNPFVPNVG